jgi:steroid delta-isomerase-like uncharacterized protein
MYKRQLSACVILIAVLVLTAFAAPPQDKSETGKSAIAEKWAAAWNSHNADKMVAAFTDDVYYEDVAFGEVNHGTAELRKFATDEWAGVSDLEIKVLRASVHAGHGTIEWTFSGTDKGVFNTGKKFTVRGVSVVDVRGRKIARCVDYYDAAAIMRQVGALPATPEPK